MGTIGESMVGHAASWKKPNGKSAAAPTAAQDARQSAIMAGCRHW